MSTGRNFLPVYTLVNASSMTGNITSAVVDARYMTQIGFEMVWTGTPTGTLNVQASADQVTWNSLTPAPTAPAGSASSVYYDIVLTSAPYLRVTYTAGSSTGSLTVFVTGKGQ